MIEISVRGKWVKVPAFRFGDKTIIVRGGFAKIARVHDEAWLESGLDNPQGCLEELRKQKLKADLFTFAEMPPGEGGNYPYHRETDSIAVVTLDSFKNWWEGLPQETRKNVRRSARCGVRIEVKELDDDLVKDLAKLNDSSPIRQGRRYTHYGKSFEQVKKDHSSFLDRSDFICAYVGDELVGYVKLVRRGKIASVLNILTNDQHRDKRPANALMHAVVERCFEAGFTHLTYGFFHHGNKKDATITLFKVRHGFEEILVPRYFVPLTLRGKLCLRLGLHRGLIGVLPNSVLVKAVALRAKWYTFSSWLISRCSSIVKRPNSNRQMGRAIPPAGSNS